MNLLPRKVAVLGGGYAGMAAAVTLAEQGIPVTVYEAAARLGGRARRVDYNGTTLDNGLHVLIGACRETLRLIALVGGRPEDALVRLPLDWRIGTSFRLHVPPLPAPLHLAGALLAARGASFGARLAAARFVGAMRSRQYRLETDTTVARLLAAHRQHESMVRHLWQPLCTSTLNTPLEEASAQSFLNVLRDGLAADRRNSDLLVARRDLTALFPDPAARYVRERGGELRLGHTVSAVTSRGGGYEIAARDSRETFAGVVCALSPYRLRAALADLPQLAAPAAMVGRFRYQPIYSVYLQYPEHIGLPAPMMGLSGGAGQWVFDRQQICGQTGLAAVVISASGSHQRLPLDVLARRVHEDMVSHFGALPAPVWHRVIAEKRATFACTPDLERPAHQTVLAGFFLAGDYTAGDYPATIEGAVRSGVRAARALLESVA